MLVLPVVVFFAVKRICEELRASDLHPLRDWTGTVVRRTDEGGFAVVDTSPEGPDEVAAARGDPRREPPPS